jgi:hypothetical protein
VKGKTKNYVRESISGKGGTTMSKWDGKFNGTYETSRYGKQSLADDIMDAGCGTFTYASSTGGLVRETDSRIDVWGKGDGNGNYPHYYYNGPNDYGKAPDGRHK